MLSDEDQKGTLERNGLSECRFLPVNADCTRKNNFYALKSKTSNRGEINLTKTVKMLYDSLYEVKLMNCNKIKTQQEPVKRC